MSLDGRNSPALINFFGEVCSRATSHILRDPLMMMLEKFDALSSFNHKHPPWFIRLKLQLE